MASVSLERVTKEYRTRRSVVRAVRDFSIDIADGEFIVLVGPSGCGKTTTLRMIAGLEDISSGTVRIDGAVVNRVAPKDRDIAMVFQNYALYPHMTAYDNMAFALKIRRMPKAEIRQKIADTADLLGISHLLHRKPRDLSGGERQRVAVGRAIVRRPRVFLFDEPLSNLDARLRTHMRTEIKTLHQRLRTTAIYVTHDQEEAMTLGDRLVLMHDGVIQQAGAPMELYTRPANRFVAGFIGSPAMNFLSATLDGDARRPSLGAQEGSCSLPPPVAERLKSSGARAVEIGFRPEHIRLTPRASDASPERGVEQEGLVVRARVSVIEPLGDTMNVHAVTTGGASLVARLPAGALAVDQQVDLSVPAPRLHFFATSLAGERLA